MRKNSRHLRFDGKVAFNFIFITLKFAYNDVKFGATLNWVCRGQVFAGRFGNISTALLLYRN